MHQPECAIVPMNQSGQHTPHPIIFALAADAYTNLYTAHAEC